MKIIIQIVILGILLACLFVVVGVSRFDFRTLNGVIFTSVFPTSISSTTPPIDLPPTGNPNANNNDGQPIYACTMDARICPDGSAVGRTGPKCEFAACPIINIATSSNNQGEVNGFISGHVNIGPMCPVERVDFPCVVSPEVYTSREVVVYNPMGTGGVVRGRLDEKGNYKISIGTGIYLIQIRPAGIGEGEKRVVEVFSGKTSVINFDIDTGIR